MVVAVAAGVGARKEEKGLRKKGWNFLRPVTKFVLRQQTLHSTTTITITTTTTTDTLFAQATRVHSESQKTRISTCLVQTANSYSGRWFSSSE